MDFPMKYLLATIGGATAIMLLLYFADQSVLATAAKYADDEPQLMKFMSDMGYPKKGEWCGEFAASIIKMAGGTPPSGAAIASNWRRYGMPDAMPHVGDVAVADRDVPTGATGSHVGFVIGVDLENDTFTLESGNTSNIYTARKISCFTFHTPPGNVLSALTGNGFRSGTAIGRALTGLPLIRASFAAYPFGRARSSDPDDCGQRSLDADYAATLQRMQALANGLDGKRACVVHLPSPDAPGFCSYARVTREASMSRPYWGCTATTTKGRQCLAWNVSGSACYI
jgi:CHAP domain